MNKYRNTNAANTTKTYNKNEIEDPTNNIYEAISIIAKRSSQINSCLLYTSPSPRDRG